MSKADWEEMSETWYDLDLAPGIILRLECDYTDSESEPKNWRYELSPISDTISDVYSFKHVQRTACVLLRDKLDDLIRELDKQTDDYIFNY